jgi:hypothetical protein
MVPEKIKYRLKSGKQHEMYVGSSYAWLQICNFIQVDHKQPSSNMFPMPVGI